MKAETSFFVFSEPPKISAITFLLIALCAASCSAFLPVVAPLESNVMSDGVVPSCSTRRGLPGALFMAKPGMSDARARQEREAEIQSKISRMKREGKMKNKDGTAQSAEDSAMLEAEAFFNKPNPRLKFERQERKRVEAEAAAAAEQESKSPDDEPSQSLDGVL
jgi:hypothetical protein